MRLWTLHPAYLDARGLTALWREALLAQQVLTGHTKGYRHHPQLARFRDQPDPGAAIGAYLRAVYEEARTRGYRFDASKIRASEVVVAPILTTKGQLDYEWRNLKGKLAARDPRRLQSFKTVISPEPHPLFRLTSGPVACWEVTGTASRR